MTREILLVNRAFVAGVNPLSGDPLEFLYCGKNQIQKAVKQVVLTKIKDLAAGKMGYSTSEVGDLVVEAMNSV